jgi:hypothetical protein
MDRRETARHDDPDHERGGLDVQPYDELDIPKDATDAEIRRAYRRRSSKAHPDKGGTAEEFRRVHAAYQVLTDRTKRAQFDKSGRADASFQDDRAVMLEDLAALVLGVIDHPQTQLEYVDVIGSVRNSLERDILELEVNRTNLQRKIAKRERAAKRLRRIKGGENLVAAMIRAEILRIQEQIEDIAPAIAHKRGVLAIAGEYAYRTGPDDHRPANVYVQFLTGGAP